MSARFLILQWRGDYWRPMDSDSDRLWAIPYESFAAAATALTDYLVKGAGKGSDPKHYTVYEAVNYPTQEDPLAL